MIFNQYTNINYVSIPDGAVFRGEMSDMFYGMSNLAHAFIANSAIANVTNVSRAFYECVNLYNAPMCMNSPNIVDMFEAFYGCTRIYNSPICGPNVINMSGAYRGCTRMTGSPVCENRVVDMSYTYYSCYNLTGSPVCGDNVINMYSSYDNCRNLNGPPVCGNNVVNMHGAYWDCRNMTGSPVCGQNVTNMRNAYMGCSNITGSPVCGNNVKIMSGAYCGCTNLSGAPICGVNVTHMGGDPEERGYGAYENCPNIYGNAYFYSPNVSVAQRCFYGRNTSNRLNIYTIANSTTMNTLLISTSSSVVGGPITWTNDMETNGCHYNVAQNIYIYPVDSIDEIRTTNGD